MPCCHADMDRPHQTNSMLEKALGDDVFTPSALTCEETGPQFDHSTCSGFKSKDLNSSKHFDVWVFGDKMPLSWAIDQRVSTRVRRNGKMPSWAIAPRISWGLFAFCTTSHFPHSREKLNKHVADVTLETAVLYCPI